MTMHSLIATQIIPADADRTWAFFSNSANLGRITPAGLGFVMHSTPEPAHEGQLIDYMVRPLAGIPMHWETRIDQAILRLHSWPEMNGR